MESIPTPVGSTTRYSGSMVLAIVRTDEAKSVFVEQQIQPSVSSQILREESDSRAARSIEASPYSFSITAKSCRDFFAISRINVVFPAPRKPETIRTFK